MSILEDNVVAAALRDRGVGQRDRERCVAWWLFSKPGESMMLVGPDLKVRIEHDGTVVTASAT